MPTPRRTKEDHIALLALLNKHKGDRAAAASAAGISTNTLTSRMRLAQETMGADYFDHLPKKTGGQPAVSDDLIDEAWQAYASHGYVATEAAEALGMKLSTFKGRLKAARLKGYTVPSLGTLDAKKATRLDLPAPGKVKRYILTSAQNNTRLHEKTWASLHALAAHYGAQLMISTFTYIHRQEGSAKRGTGKKHRGEPWYDPAIEPYVTDDFVQLAPGLVWCGHMNISPTAEDPLSGLDSYTGRASSIFPHPKIAMKSIATVKQDAAKFMWTTGAVTLRNYIQRKAGLKGEFHHVFGGLLVEVDSDGHWWVRQVSAADKAGWIYDLDIVAKPDGTVTKHDGVEAIGFGDIHEDEIDPEVRNLAWAPGGMVDVLKPRYQVLHDVIDFGRRSHHTRRNRHKRFEYWVKGRESVMDEVEGVSKFLAEASRPWSKLVVVRSNHDEHLERWLNETDWHDDMQNAELHLKLQAEYLRAIREGRKFNALEWTCRKIFNVKGVKWLEGDESFVVCRDASGGIEMGLHGDKAAHGARGSLKAFSRLGRKVVIFHSHHAGIYGPAWQGGTSSKRDLGYNAGPDAWSHTHVVVHRNGKRQMVTMYANKWRA